MSSFLSASRTRSNRKPLSGLTSFCEPFQNFRDAIARNPFAKRPGLEPSKLAVTFFAKDPGKEAREDVLKIKIDAEELRLNVREMYIYFPNGMAGPSFFWSVLERILKTSLTSRKWNTVTKLLQLAETLEAANRNSETHQPHLRGSSGTSNLHEIWISFRNLFWLDL